MNDKALYKLYDRLTPRERLPAIVSASRRGDAVEYKRLMDSAPRLRFEVAHHHGLATALSHAADWHLLTLLDLAANYWQWWGLWGWCRSRPAVRESGGPGGVEDAGDTDVEAFRHSGLVRYHAFLFVAHVDGWKQFCRDWPIEPEALLDFKPGWGMVSRTEPRARENAFTREEAARFLWDEMQLSQEFAREESALPQVMTAEDLAEAWHAIVDYQTNASRG